jgi:5'-3' exonuclease
MLKGDENDFEEAINSTLKSCINLEKDSLFYKCITENKDAIKLMASKWINMSEQDKLAYIN